MRLPLIIVIDEELSVIFWHGFEGVRHCGHLKQTLFSGGTAALRAVWTTALMWGQGLCSIFIVRDNRSIVGVIREIALRDLIVPLWCHNHLVLVLDDEVSRGARGQRSTLRPLGQGGTCSRSLILLLLLSKGGRDPTRTACRYLIVIVIEQELRAIITAWCRLGSHLLLL